MMADVIDLTGERNRRAAPDPEFVRKDEYGRELFCFLLSYEQDGRGYSTDLWAYDEADARAKVAAMRSSLVFDGQLFEQLPA